MMEWNGMDGMGWVDDRYSVDDSIRDDGCLTLMLEEGKVCTVEGTRCDEEMQRACVRFAMPSLQYSE